MTAGVEGIGFVDVSEVAGLAPIQPIPLARLEAFRKAMGQEMASSGVAPRSVSAAESVWGGSSEGGDIEVRRASLGGLTSDGDAILNGLLNLRNVLDVSHSRVIDALGGAASTGVEGVMATQLNLANWSLLVDLMSKVAAKTTQTVDTLMKG